MKRWSNSSLYTLQQCGERFRRKYIERDFRPSGIKAKRGIAVHRVAKTSHRRQFTAKEQGFEGYKDMLPTVEEAKDIAADSFAAAVEEGVGWKDDEKSVGVAKVRGQELDKSVGMAATYVVQRAPQVDPEAVERKILIQPSDAGDIEILGYIDLVAKEELLIQINPEETETREVETVWDLKTSDRSPRAGAAGQSQQLTLYALIRAAEGKLPDYVGLATLVPNRAPVLDRAKKSTEDLEAVAARISAAIRTVEAGVFTPANPDAWWCSARWCDYHGDCPFALGRVSVAVGGER